MKKNNNSEETGQAVMSSQMVKNLKSKIAQYGFESEEYINFLISVCAMKDRDTVVKFPNEELSEYRDRFVKESEYSIGDSFQIDKCKITAEDSKGHRYDTGYFCPRSFWDNVLKNE